MKVCVALRGWAPANLRSDNLRSEARWERQALEACLENPEVSEVYTIGSDWGGSHPKYRGGMNGAVASQTVLLCQDWNRDTVNRFHFKAAIVNIFSGPWVEQINEVKSTYSRMNGNLFFTMGFPILYRNELRLDEWRPDLHMAASESHLEKFLPRSNILLLPVPAAPYLTVGNNFDSKNLMWAQRLVFMSQMGDSATLLWSIQMLDKDPSLTLDVLTGWFAEEVKDYVNEQVVYRADITDAFWKLPNFVPFSHVRDRVRVHLSLGWDQVLSINSQSKLLTTYGRSFGGPPIEAAMHGIPFVASGKTGALCDCENYLHVNSEIYTTSGEPSACDVLGKLYQDRDYYTLIGNSYRSYVSEHYTYDAFNRNLNKILSDRGLM